MGPLKKQGSKPLYNQHNIISVEGRHNNKTKNPSGRFQYQQTAVGKGDDVDGHAVQKVGYLEAFKQGGGL